MKDITSLVVFPVNHLANVPTKLNQRQRKYTTKCYPLNQNNKTW